MVLPQVFPIYVGPNRGGAIRLTLPEVQRAAC